MSYCKCGWFKDLTEIEGQFYCKNCLKKKIKQEKQNSQSLKLGKVISKMYPRMN